MEKKIAEMHASYARNKAIGAKVDVGKAEADMKAAEDKKLAEYKVQRLLA